MGNKRYGVVYLCIHQKLGERVNPSRIMSKKYFERILGETFHIPKPMRIVVLKEMVNQGLIKDMGNTRNHNIRILQPKKDLEEAKSEIYQSVGLF